MQDRNGKEIKKGDRVTFFYIAATDNGSINGTIIDIYRNRVAMIKTDDNFTNSGSSLSIIKI